MKTNEELRKLAEQLKNPNGCKGIEIAEMMNETNIKMTHHSIDCLEILDEDNILELGHGNCAHLPYLFQHNNINYCGLEISELMNSEAKRINQLFVENGKADFRLYNGLNIPFQDNYFDKAFTVNTIYFWSKPKVLLTELYRILKPNGKLNITFACQNFMAQLPFTQFGFTLYNNEKIKRLITTTPFKIISSDTQTETVKSKMGEMIDRTFTTITLKK